MLSTKKTQAKSNAKQNILNRRKQRKQNTKENKAALKYLTTVAFLLSSIEYSPTFFFFRKAMHSL